MKLWKSREGEVNIIFTVHYLYSFRVKKIIVHFQYAKNIRHILKPNKNHM